MPLTGYPPFAFLVDQIGDTRHPILGDTYQFREKLITCPRIGACPRLRSVPAAACAATAEAASATAAAARAGPGQVGDLLPHGLL